MRTLAVIQIRIFEYIESLSEDRQPRPMERFIADYILWCDQHNFREDADQSWLIEGFLMNEWAYRDSSKYFRKSTTAPDRKDFSFPGSKS